MGKRLKTGAQGRGRGGLQVPEAETETKSTTEPECGLEYFD